MRIIQSKYDVRLVTLLGVAVSCLETLALELNVDPDLLLAETLYKTTKSLHEIGEETIFSKIEGHYPIIEDMLD